MASSSSSSQQVSLEPQTIQWLLEGGVERITDFFSQQAPPIGAISLANCWSLLNGAVDAKSIPLLRFLLDSRPELIVSSPQYDVLSLVVDANWLAGAQTVVQAGSNALSNPRKNYLYKPILRDNLPLVRYLISKTPSARRPSLLRRKEDDLTWPLAQVTSVAMARYLISLGADPLEKSDLRSGSISPLNHAIEEGNDALIGYFVGCGVPVDSYTIYYTLINFRIGWLKDFLRYQPDLATEINQSDNDLLQMLFFSDLPMREYTAEEVIDVVKYLRSLGVPTHRRNNNGSTAFFLAVENYPELRHIPILEFLLKIAGPDHRDQVLYGPDKSGRTPLMELVAGDRQPDPNMLIAFLRLGYDNINAEGEGGWRATEVAASSDSTRLEKRETLKILLALGAELDDRFISDTPNYHLNENGDPVWEPLDVDELGIPDGSDTFRYEEIYPTAEETEEIRYRVNFQPSLVARMLSSRVSPEERREYEASSSSRRFLHDD